MLTIKAIHRKYLKKDNVELFIKKKLPKNIYIKKCYFLFVDILVVHYDKKANSTVKCLLLDQFRSLGHLR